LKMVNYLIKIARNFACGILSNLLRYETETDKNY